MNNEDLFRRLLLIFNDVQKSFEPDFLTYLQQQDYESAEKLAHTLKGVSANLAMMDLHEAAKQLEFSCKQQDKDIQEKLTAVLKQLKGIFNGLENLK